MSEILNLQIITFLYSCILGLALGLLYDAFRIIRMIINPKYIGMFIQDIIYFLISAIVTFLFVLSFNKGETRLYILAGEAIGWVVYHITLGNIIYKRSQKIVACLKTKLHILNLFKNIGNKNIENEQTTN